MIESSRLFRRWRLIWRINRMNFLQISLKHLDILWCLSFQWVCCCSSSVMRTFTSWWQQYCKRSLRSLRWVHMLQLRPLYLSSQSLWLEKDTKTFKGTQVIRSRITWQRLTECFLIAQKKTYHGQTFKLAIFFTFNRTSVSQQIWLSLAAILKACAT